MAGRGTHLTPKINAPVSINLLFYYLMRIGFWSAGGAAKTPGHLTRRSEMNLLTAAKAALEALETCDWNDNDFPDDTQYFDRFAVSEAATKLRAAIEEAEKQEPEHCMCPACINGNLHASDCAVHNAPALPIGECDCGLLNPAAPTVPDLWSTLAETVACFEDPRVSD